MGARGRMRHLSHSQYARGHSRGSACKPAATRPEDGGNSRGKPRALTWALAFNNVVAGGTLHGVRELSREFAWESEASMGTRGNFDRNSCTHADTCRVCGS